MKKITLKNVISNASKGKDALLNNFNMNFNNKNSVDIFYNFKR